MGNTRHCPPLELIAFAVHPGDSQSTTTACLDETGRCLYLTSQTNLKFDGVDRDVIHKIIDLLTLTSSLYQEGKIDRDSAKSHFWEQFCALAKKEQILTSKKSLDGINKLYHGLYDKLWQTFFARSYSVTELQGLKNLIWQVSIIEDTDIFFGKIPDKTGFHGESRILRFLFIGDYPRIHLAKTGTFFYLLPGDGLSATVKQNAYTWFKENLHTQHLAMGSSQGTCQGCAACLDDYKVAHGAACNNPSQWLDPLTMCGFQGTTTITKSDSHHAIFVAFKYLIRPED